MEQTTSRRPILKKNVEAFVPSPHFLSESPGKPHLTHISRPGQPVPPNSFSPSPSVRQLHSPVPPPPANLFGGNPGAFNVDPGVPFLATAGTSDDGNSDKGSISEVDSSKQSVGAFVTGLKKALTRKGSRRRSSRYEREEMYPPQMYPPQMIIRDSGYAASSPLEEPPANQQPPVITFTPAPPSPRDLPQVVSDPPLNHYQSSNGHRNDALALAPHHPPSSESMASAVTALVEYGPDYIKMDRPTPPLSDVSFNTYMVRFQNFIHNLAALPWVATERVTVDYYPTSAERLNNRLPHRPLITWHSKDYSHADYHLDSDSIDSLTLKMTPRLQRLKAPSHASRIDINLDSEFSDRTRSPFPYHPPNIIQTPDHRRPRSEGFKEVGYPSLPQASKSPLPPSSVQRQWEDPSFNPIQPYVPNWGNAPDTLPLFPPNSGQTPMMYPEESRPESRTDTNTNALLQTPAAQKFGLSYTEGPETLSGGGTYGEDPRLRSQNDANVTFFSTPTRPRPASVRSNRRWESTPKPDYLASPKHTLPSHRYPDPGSGQYPISGSPSRRSRKSSSAGSQPGGESTEAWENFPQDRPGFVPFEYSENYYGTRYGVGIHGLLPPVGRVSNDASADASPVPSIKQPQPQYPKPTLVTPPSQASSL